MARYARDADGVFPADFQTLIANSGLDEFDFWCPGGDPESEDPYDCYRYVAGQTTADDPNNVLIYERPGCHEGAGGSVLFLDGRVEFVEPYGRVKDLVRETQGRLATPPDE
jgi:hypothetical protein